MSRFIRNPGDLDPGPSAPLDVQRALAGFNAQPVTTAEQLAAARELAAAYSTSTTPKGANMSSTDRRITPTRQTAEDAAAAAAAGRAAAAETLGRELAEMHMTPDQRARAVKIAERRAEDD